MEGTDSGRLALYPQLFMACLAVLCTSFVHVFALALSILSQVGTPRISQGHVQALILPGLYRTTAMRDIDS